MLNHLVGEEYKMGILLTGSDGFIGSNLKLFFLKKNYKVFSPSLDQLDLRDSSAVENFFKKHNITCIVHSATVLHVNKSYDEKVCEDNLKMFFNLIRYKKDGCKFINLGSGSEYSRDHWVPKMTEDYFEKHIPQDSHSLSKYIASKYIKDSRRDDLYHLRIFGIFGPREDYRYKFISNAITKKILGLPITINKNVFYDYLYIKDFCNIVDFFIKNDTHEKIFNTTPSESIDLISIVRIVDNVLASESKLIILKPDLGREYSGDNKKLLSTIGNYFKFTEFKDAISELTEFYLGIKNEIDTRSLMEDSFLEYAKKINP